MKKSAFTLIELIIVIVLFGMLSGIILQTYSTITKVTFRIEQDKELAKQTLMLSQMLDNLSQTATIDYEHYGDSLVSKQGITDILYLTGGQRTGVQVFSTGHCENAAELYNEDYLTQKQDEKTDFTSCRLVLKQEEQEITLLGSGNYLVSKVMFKVVPYETLVDTLSSETQGGKPAFWLLGAVYSRFYNPKNRSTSSILPLQIFFGLKGTTPNLYALTDNHED